MFLVTCEICEKEVTQVVNGKTWYCSRCDKHLNKENIKVALLEEKYYAR